MADTPINYTDASFVRPAGEAIADTEAMFNTSTEGVTRLDSVAKVREAIAPATIRANRKPRTTTAGRVGQEFWFLQGAGKWSIYQHSAPIADGENPETIGPWVLVQEIGLQSGVFTSTKSFTANCPAGQTGAPMTREATRSSTISQDDADAQALAAATQAATAALVCSVVVVTPTNQIPAVSVAASPSPATVGVSMTLTATANDADGEVVKVEYYNGQTKLGETGSAPPYTFTYAPTAPGTLSLTAKAYDNAGGVGTSSALSVTVNNPAPVNQLPAANLSVPKTTLANGESMTATATASDPDGTVVKVELLDGTAVVAEDSTSPYSLNYASTVAGQHTLRARATDNNGGATLSAPVTVTVQAAVVVPASYEVNLGNGQTDAQTGVLLTVEPAEPDVLRFNRPAAGDTSPGDMEIVFDDITVALVNFPLYLVGTAYAYDRNGQRYLGTFTNGKSTPSAQ
ncbi:Ig-like domain-containing protein [Hymenobacter koreensis]|uniref:PKD/Chitinase domain-containing protein n=1 Tax=Hymenobacter koreensis TaxID=1084523 RepID=A0ABP8JJR6_9BACT